MKNNKVIVFTGPSGVGKATVEKKLFEDKSLRLCFSISATTRAARPGEEHGKQYYFISHEDFDQKIKNDEFVEWNAHFSNKYGTLKSEIKRIQDEGFLPFLEVEVNGAENVIKRFGKENVVSIFLAPPSISELKERITLRGTETPEQIDERIARVEEEMQHITHFDFIVVNDTLDHAVDQVKNILKGIK